MEEFLTDSMKESILKFIDKDKNDSPFYVADLADILYKAKYWKKMLPRIRIFYAIKSNNDPMLVKFLVSLGCGFDCASRGEIEMAISAGVPPQDVIFAHPVKPRSSLLYAASVNVDLMTFDCEHELKKIKEVYPSSRLVIRIKTPPVRCYHPFNDKFGCEMEEVRHLLQLAWNLHLNVVGVSFHVGSLCEEPEGYATAIRMGREVFDIAKEEGFKFTLLDIGGGFPGASGTLPHCDKLAFGINQALEEYFPPGCGIDIIAEPGHYIGGSAYLLCTKIIGKKFQAVKESGQCNGHQEKKLCYFMNDGQYLSFDRDRATPLKMRPLLSREEAASRKVRPCRLWGVSLSNFDIIIDGHAPEMEEGECIVFVDMGAYTLCLSCQFNGFFPPNIYHIFSEYSWYENSGDLPSEDFLKDLNPKQLKTFQEIKEMVQSGRSNIKELRTMKGDTYFELLKSKSSRPSFDGLREYHQNVGSELGEDRPFYSFDLADILWKDQIWRENLPKVDPFYAVKANADPLLVKLFVLLGYGFDCSTEGEIRLVLGAGADPKRIIFAHTIKTQAALKYASREGVELMTFDSSEELLKISRIYPTARLVLRVKSQSSQTVYNLSKKFGADAKRADKLLLKAKELGLNVVGVSFHVGALCEDPLTFTSTIEKCRNVFDTAKRLGFNLNVVNIGAGFFGSKLREKFFYTLSKEINASLEKNFPDKDTVWMAEPGCFSVCSAVTLTTTIIGKKSKDDENDEIQKEYYLNDGFYSSFFEHNDIYDVQYHPLLPPEEMNRRGGKLLKSKLWGLTCCSEDVVREEALLPEMESGEMILWENMGAYSRGVCSTFTCVPFPDSRYVFIRNPRLKYDSIPNLEEVSKLIVQNVTFVNNDDVTANSLKMEKEED